MLIHLTTCNRSFYVIFDDFNFFSGLSFVENVSENSNRLNNVYIINLPHCKDVTVKKELVGAESSEPQSINLTRVSICGYTIFHHTAGTFIHHVLISLLILQLSNRVRNQVDQKKRLVSALKANASEDAQNLYIFLAKMLTVEQGLRN